MACEWGMSPSLGPVHFGGQEGPVFLGSASPTSTSRLLAEALLERETIAGLELDGLLAGEKIARPTPA
jgi:ATP-dependent Zn protease